MMSLWLLLFACAPEAPRGEPPVAVVVPEAVAPASAEPLPPPEGDLPRMTAEPILPQVIVLGALDVADVEAGLAPQRAALRACYDAERERQPTLRGKVALKFVIAMDGSVVRSEVRSTSLRSPPVERCLQERLAQTRFRAPSTGTMAIVTYPFAFPGP